MAGRNDATGCIAELTRHPSAARFLAITCAEPAPPEGDTIHAGGHQDGRALGGPMRRLSSLIYRPPDFVDLSSRPHGPARLRLKGCQRATEAAGHPAVSVRAGEWFWLTSRITGLVPEIDTSVAASNLGHLITDLQISGDAANSDA